MLPAAAGDKSVKPVLQQYWYPKEHWAVRGGYPLMTPPLVVSQLTIGTSLTCIKCSI